MCLAVPVEIVSINADGMAKCRVGQSDTFVDASTILLPTTPVVGDFLIIHAGFALRKTDREDAEKTLDLFREMAAHIEPDQASK